MKQPKKLTRDQKEVLTANGYSWKKWSLVEETEFYIKVINRETGKRLRLDKFFKGRK